MSHFYPAAFYLIKYYIENSNRAVVVNHVPFTIYFNVCRGERGRRKKKTLRCYLSDTHNGD